MVLRLIPQTILSLEDLQLPEVLKNLANRPKGLVLVTGPTGSGKSTTLAAMVDWINRNKPAHILTIEDPIEFVHTSRKALVRQREVGHHTALQSGAAGSSTGRPRRDLDRRDPRWRNPDHRSRGSPDGALGVWHLAHQLGGSHRGAGAGHGPPADQASLRRSLSESLLGVIAQGLIRTTSGGRRAYHDILINTEACRDYIERGELDSVEQIMERSGFDGMQTTNQALLQLVQAGEIEGDAALAVSLKSSELAQALRGRQ